MSRVFGKRKINFETTPIPINHYFGSGHSFGKTFCFLGKQYVYSSEVSPFKLKTYKWTIEL